MIESIPAEVFPLILLFTAIFLLLRIFKRGLKIALILSAILTFAIPLAAPEQFDRAREILSGFGATNIVVLSSILFLLGLVAGIKRKKVRKLADIEILGKLEFKKADLIGKLSLARAKGDRVAEKAIAKEIERVDKEIKALKARLGRRI